MEKKNFITLLLGTIGGLLFSLGMCMCLLTEWGVFSQGVAIGSVGIIVLLITYITYRKMSGKAPIKINAATVAKVLYGIISIFVFGLGMSIAILYSSHMITGIIIGVIGIIMLLFLIPLCLGFKETHQ